MHHYSHDPVPTYAYRLTPWGVRVDVPLLAFAISSARISQCTGHEVDVPLWMVARPRAAPIPRPRIALGPTRLNLFIS